MIDLDELERLLAKATPPPWTWSSSLAEWCAANMIGNAENDALLISRTRDALPELIRELRAAREFRLRIAAISNGYFNGDHPSLLSCKAAMDAIAEALGEPFAETTVKP